MRYRICLFLFLLFAFTANAQSVIDSLKNKLAVTKDTGKEKADLLNSLGYEYWIIDSKKSIEYGLEALKLTEQLNYKAGKAKAERVLGVAYWTQGHFTPALQYLNDSQQLYRELRDEEGVANTLLNTGMIYADVKDYDTALEYYDKAIEKFLKLGLKNRIATTYTKIGTVMIEREQYADAREYLVNALNIHSENNFTYGKAESHNRLGRLFIELNDYGQAEYHLRKAIVHSKEINDEDGLISNLILFGRLLIHKKDYEAAEIHFTIALNKATNKNLDKYRLEVYKELITLYRKKDNLNESLKYFDKFAMLKDSIYNISVSNQMAALQFKNKLAEKNNELEYLESKQKKDTIITVVLVIGLLIISALSFFLIRSLKNKNKTQQGELGRNRSEAQMLIENERQKQAELEEELSIKHKELTSYTLNFVQKNELLDQLEEKIKGINELPPQRQAKTIKEVEKIIRINKNVDKDWEDFKIHFEKVHINFFTNLKMQYPQLSSNDLKLAALIRLNLNIKESANILGISPDSVKTARYRLRRKFGLEQDENLLSFLLDIESDNIRT